MDGNINQQDMSGSYIWLRYATQSTRDGQTHTMEISVPVPIGASPEMRERLIREAEAGMNQLASHFEQRGLSLPERSQSSQGLQGTQRVAPQPASNTRPTPAPQRPAVRSAAVSAPHTAPQSVPAPANESEHEPVPRAVETQRPHTVTNPARTPGRVVDASSNLQLPQFIQYIKEYMDLSPKQAMELLNVKSLSTGINLRDALEQLKVITGQQGPAGATLSAQKRQDNEPDDPAPARPPSTPTARLDEGFARSSTGPLPRVARDSAPIIEMRVRRPAAGFDEEVGPDELDDPDEAYDDLEDLEMSRHLSPQLLSKARTKLGELRESQGAATASAGRLQALNNVAVSQITEDQLQELAEGVWGIMSLKKLKVDQVEALISWAKLEDDFAEQVEAVLAILEEERYARGNR